MRHHGAVRTVDLNGDCGESFGRWSLGDDEALLTVLTSANVACGFHAGDPSTLRRTVRAAAGGGVAVGAQVSYRDLAGFGRRFVDVPAAELTDEVLYQLGALAGFARAAGTRVSYLKPHGALYHAVGHHEQQARAVLAAVVEFDPGMAVLGLPGSLFLRLAEEAGVAVRREAFADRAYRADGTLVPRSQPGAVLHDPAAIAARAVRIVVDGVVLADDGSAVEVRCDSLCVHGDTPGAVAIAREVRAALEAAGVTVAAPGGG